MILHVSLTGIHVPIQSFRPGIGFRVRDFLPLRNEDALTLFDEHRILLDFRLNGDLAVFHAHPHVLSISVRSEKSRASNTHRGRSRMN